MLHFEVSRSKRSLGVGIEENELERTTRGISYHPLMRTLSPDRHFDWQSVIYQTLKPDEKGIEKSKTNVTGKKIYRIIPLSMKLMTKLGVKILQNRRLCFGGRPIQGIFLPRNRSFQVDLVKRFLVWYSPCIEFYNNIYKINEYCMKRREYDFLKMYLQSVGYHHPSWKKGNIYDQFYTPK